MAALLSAQDLEYTLGGRPIFEGLSFVAEEGERLALIGPNGAGKSTLLKILTGELDPEHGEVARRRDLSVAYVPQQENLPLDLSIRTYLQQSNPSEHLPIERTLDKYLHNLELPSLDSQLELLSGGQQKRVSLLKAAISEPDLLILDEPTNHLDVDGILWLEELVLNHFPSTLFVSHDRYLIERLATRVVEIERRYPAGFLSVKGSYSDFLEARTNFFETLQSQHASLKNKVRRETEWLRQGVKARTTKSKYRIDEAHKLINEMNAIVLEERSAEMDFSETGRKTKELIKIEHVSKSFDDRPIVREFSFVISPGMRIGIIGPNGSGKTTLMQLLSGDLKPDMGKVKRSNYVQTAVFGQKREELNQNELLKFALSDDGQSVVFNGREINIVGWAKRFLFKPDQLNLPVRSLSGGEQARVLLARIMRKPADVLFLDEPTNDLDIATLEVLEESLLEFSGAVVLVSHDRHLMDRVSTTILGLPGGGLVVPFADYTQWEISQRDRKSNRVSSRPQEKTNRSVSGELSFEERKELSSLERRISKVEERISILRKELENPLISSNAATLSSKWSEIGEKESEYENLFHRWEELHNRADK